MMPHPLIPVSLPPASVTMAMSQMNHLSTIANMAAAAHAQSAPSRMVTSVIKVTHGAVLSLYCAHLSSAIEGRWRGLGGAWSVLSYGIAGSSLSDNSLGKKASRRRGGGTVSQKKRRKKHGRLCVCRSVLLKRMCHVMAALAVFVFSVGCAGTGPRQSLPCPLSGRRQEAGEPSLIPAQQQRLQLSRVHGELLRQNAYVHLINLSPTLFVSQFISLVSSSVSAHRRTRY